MFDASVAVMTERYIYVLLLDEGLDVWRPVRAIEISPACFKIIESESQESGEIWQFNEGQEVLVENRLLDGEEVLVAVAAQKESRFH